jgi:DNA-binding GntR family transcriptional regulator
MQAGSLPLYEQTRQNIYQMIQNRLSPGDLLPTQEELSRQLGTSLITIKRALNELAKDQVVESIRGRGTVVRGTNITDSRQGISSWTDSVVGLGERPQTGWTTLERHVPEAFIRRLLNLKARQPVVTVNRLRLVDDKPICLMKNCLPAARVPGLEEQGLSHESLYHCLEKRFGLRFHKASETVRARKSSAQERKHLSKDATIVLEIERVTEDENGQALEWAQVVAHADRYTYQMQLINP